MITCLGLGYTIWFVDLMLFYNFQDLSADEKVHNVVTPLFWSM